MAKSLKTQFVDYMTLNRYSPWTIKKLSWHHDAVGKISSKIARPAFQ